MTTSRAIAPSAIREPTLGLVLLVAIFAVAAVNSAGAQTFTTLHTFTGTPDGSSPFGGLVADRNGNYYGTTQFGGTNNNGTVFELSPPVVIGNPWTETVIWNFGGAGGGDPSYQLVIDAKGNLYGETQVGGNGSSGTVFVLVPPATGGTHWTKRILYALAGVGAYPYGGLILDSAGAVYGTQYGGGTFGFGEAFKVAPAAAGGYTATTLYNFGATSIDSEEPYGPLTLDSSGNLYGVSNNGGADNLGTVYKLTPPVSGSGTWTNTILYSFPGASAGCYPEGNVILDKAGRVYGQATGCGGTANQGVIFRLTPTGSGAWVESVLHTFSSTDGGGPYPSLSLDAKANVFYGTSFYGGVNGVVFELKPPAPGGGTWIEKVLHTFTDGSDGFGPLGPIVWDSNGVLYGTAYSSNGGLGSYGTAFSIVP